MPGGVFCRLGFAYNAWGDLTAAADRDNGVTAHGYDAGGRMVSLAPPGATAASFSYDALGRPASRTIGAASLAYRYVGTTPVSYATVPSAGAATYGLLDATGSRVALNTGGTTAWSAFDLHGNLVGATASGSGTMVNAIRYDPYGATLDAYTAGSGSTATPWRYQGRLDLSPDADEPLYDYGARRYRPSAAAFTQLDTYPGRAADPASMNRFLYAHANPTTLIDPTGHCSSCMIDGHIPLPTAGKNHAITMAAAQQQIAASASWAATSSTNTANVADAMAQAAQQAKAKTTAGTGGNGPTTILTWQGAKSIRTPLASPGAYRPQLTDPFASDPAYEQLIAGHLPRSFANDVWDVTIGQLFGVGQASMLGLVLFGGAAAEWAWSSTATLAYDRDTFLRTWDATLDASSQFAAYPVESISGAADAMLGRAVELGLAGHPGQAAGELGALGLVGGLRRGVASAADNVLDGAAVRVSVDLGHGARHVAPLGLDPKVVDAAIKNHVRASVDGARASGSFWGRVTVGGHVIEYRAFTLGDGTVNVGTFYPPRP